MSIRCAADFADWYDTVARQYSEEQLTKFVDANPNMIGVLVSGTASTVFDVSSIVFVDLARFGSGAASGTAGGVFQDVLRVLSVIPVGKVASTVGAVLRPTLGKIVNVLGQFYWASRAGKACVPISIGQALQRTGQALVVTLDDIARAAGRELSSFDGAAGRGMTPAEVKQTLVALKAKFTELPARAASSWSDLVMFAEGTEGVLLVSLRRTANRAGQISDGFHRVIVARTREGVAIIDRSGVFKSLEDLSRRYGSTGPAEFFTINQNNAIIVVADWVMDPALIGRLNMLGPLGAIVTRAAMLVGFNPSVPRAQIDAAFQAFVAQNPATPGELYPAPTRPPEMAPLLFTHEIGARIERKDWLSVISEKWYGDMLLWPVIFDFNRSPDFTHPKQMKPFMRIKVPVLPTMTSAERTAIRKRALDWR